MALRRNTWIVHFYSANFIINIRWCCVLVHQFMCLAQIDLLGCLLIFFILVFFFSSSRFFQPVDFIIDKKKLWNFHYIENSWIVLVTFDHFSEWCGWPEQDWWECWNENKIFFIFFKYPWKRKKLTRRSWLVFLWTLTTCPYCNF